MASTTSWWISLVIFIGMAILSLVNIVIFSYVGDTEVADTTAGVAKACSGGLLVTALLGIVIMVLCRVNLSTDVGPLISRIATCLSIIALIITTICYSVVFSEQERNDQSIKYAGYGLNITFIVAACVVFFLMMSDEVCLAVTEQKAPSPSSLPSQPMITISIPTGAGVAPVTTTKS